MRWEWTPTRTHHSWAARCSILGLSAVYPTSHLCRIDTSVAKWIVFHCDYWKDVNVATTGLPLRSFNWPSPLNNAAHAIP